MFDYNGLYSFLIKSDSNQKFTDTLTEGRGEGMGVGGPTQRDGGVSNCVCPECGEIFDHERGIPCTKRSCPKCNVALIGESIVKEGRGEGIGVGGLRQGDGGASKCICSSCGTAYKHERGVPCTETPCPVCGSVGRGSSESIEKSIMKSKENEKCKTNTKKKTAKTKKAKKEESSESIYQCMECGKISTTKETCSYCESANIETLFEDKKEIKEQEFRTVATGISDEDVAKKLASENGGLVIQDENDEKKFAVIIKENLDESKQGFNIECAVEVLGGTLLKFQTKANIPFMIQLDYKSYGIEDFHLSFPLPLTISGENSEGKSQDIKVKLSDAKVVWKDGKILAPESITIELDKDNKIKEIEIETTYIKK